MATLVFASCCFNSDSVNRFTRTNEPVIVKRYNRSDVTLVPLWEWRWLKQIEAANPPNTNQEWYRGGLG